MKLRLHDHMITLLQPTLSKSEVQYWLSVMLALWLKLHLFPQRSQLTPTWVQGQTWQWWTKFLKCKQIRHLSDQLRYRPPFMPCPHQLGCNMCYIVKGFLENLLSWSLVTRYNSDVSVIMGIYCQAWIQVHLFRRCIHSTL
jgi:hypothetical protein